MAFEFEDNETILVQAKWLALCKPNQFIKTSKRPTGCENLFWWLRCYPNGDLDEHKGYVSVFVYTSIGGFEADWSFTIDKVNIASRKEHTYYENPLQNGSSELASHSEIQSGLVIQNGFFVIRCKVKFKVDLERLASNISRPISEDSCIVKFDRKTLERYKPGQLIVEEKRMVDGVTWHVVYFPCGQKQEKGHVNIFFDVVGVSTKVNCYCGMSIDGVFIQRELHGDLSNTERGGSPWFTHEQIQLADHQNETIDFVCKISFETPVQTLSMEPTPSIVQFIDSEIISIKADLLNICVPNQYIETAKRSTSIENLFWWLECYPNGADEESHISVFMCTSIGGFEAEFTFILNGFGTIGHQTLYIKDSIEIGYDKLASHEQIRSGTIIQNGVFLIQCKAKFTIDPVKLANNIIPPRIIENSCIIKFDRNSLEIYKRGERVIEERQTVDGITWWIELYPCGFRENDRGYFSVFFVTTGKNITMQGSCSLSVGGAAIFQRTKNVSFPDSGHLGRPKCFSHQQIQLADHNNNVVDIVCRIRFTKPVEEVHIDENATIPFQVEIDKEKAVENYRQRHPTDTDGLEKFDEYLTCLINYYQNFKRSPLTMPSADRQLNSCNRNYYFFYAADTPPPVADVWAKLILYNLNKTSKTITPPVLWHFQYNRKISVISAADLFTNFNNASKDRPVGAFTHCLYELSQKRITGEVERYGPEYLVDYIIVTGIDDYVSEDGFEDVYNLIHPNNLSQYFDEAMPNWRIDAAEINFVFTCEKLPELLIWRLAAEMREKMIFEPEIPITVREVLETGLNTVADKPWEIVTVNCRDEVAEKIQAILNSENSAIFSLSLTKKLQKELRHWYLNWRVCGMVQPPIWRFAVPCLTFRKAAGGDTWYLVFYAPFEWSEELLDSASYECGEDDAEVNRRFDNYDDLNKQNNLNTFEQGLNNILSYPISMLFYQNASGMDHYNISIKHREAYRSVNVRSNYPFLCKKLLRTAVILDEPLKSVLLAIQQVAERAMSGHETLTNALPRVSGVTKQLMSTLHQNQYVNKKYSVIYCGRNTVLDIGNLQNAVVTVGPIKVVVIAFS